MTRLARFQTRDVLAERVIKQILSNVSSRGYEGTPQAAPCDVKTAGLPGAPSPGLGRDRRDYLLQVERGDVEAPVLYGC